MLYETFVPVHVDSRVSTVKLPPPSLLLRFPTLSSSDGFVTYSPAIHLKSTSIWYC